MTSTRRAPLGFFSGVRAFFGGVGYVTTTPSVWGWAAVPVLVATALFGAMGALASWGAEHVTDRLVADPSSAWAAGGWLLRVVLVLVGLVLAFVLAMSLAQPLSGFALDAIVRRQEAALGGRTTWPSHGLVAGAVRSLRVSLTALALGLPVLAALSVVTLLFPPASVVTVPLKLAVTGLLAAYDVLDYPLSLRGEGVRARLAFMRAHFAAVLGFGLALAAVLLVPGAGLLVLPWGVAGAARLVAQRDAGA